MPRYSFRELSSNLSNKNKQKNNLNILLDGVHYTEKVEYHEIKKIQYITKNGIVMIDGLFDLTNKDIENLIKIKSLNVSFSKELLVCSPECSYVAPKDRAGVDVKMHCNDSSLLTVAPGKTSTIVYRTEGALSHLKENQKNNNTYIICHFKNDGGKKDLRYEMPTGRLMITK